MSALLMLLRLKMLPKDQRDLLGEDSGGGLLARRTTSEVEAPD
jgi:hypothetical protein